MAGHLHLRVIASYICLQTFVPSPNDTMKLVTFSHMTITKNDRRFRQSLLGDVKVVSAKVTNHVFWNRAEKRMRCHSPGIHFSISNNNINIHICTTWDHRTMRCSQKAMNSMRNVYFCILVINCYFDDNCCPSLWTLVWMFGSSAIWSSHTVSQLITVHGPGFPNESCSYWMVSERHKCHMKRPNLKSNDQL